MDTLCRYLLYVCVDIVKAVTKHDFLQVYMYNKDKVLGRTCLLGGYFAVHYVYAMYDYLTCV